MNKIKQLETDIVTYNKNYRDGFPNISDKEYDKLLVELKQLDPNNSLLQKSIIEKIENSPRKQKLPINMYSLDKFQTFEEYLKWVEKYDLQEKYAIISAKLDGISFLEEINKNLFTRGDGVEGQLSNDHYNFVDKNIIDSNSPLTINYTWGEAMILRKDWPKVQEIFPEYKNARNGVAGIFNKEELDQRYAEALLYVTLIRYGCSFDKNKKQFSKTSQFVFLNGYQNIKIPHLNIKFKDITEELLNEKFEEWKKEFDIDGLVIDVDDYLFCKEVGNESNDNPIYSKAIKLNWEDIAETEITGIRFQVSKDGKLKPVADIKPVILAGAEVDGPTLYNVNWIYDKGIYIGAKIKIKRSGDVIPKIIEIIDPCKNALYIANEIKNLLIKQFYFLTEENFNKYINWDENHVDLVFKQRTNDWNIAEMAYFFETMKLEEFGEPSVESLYKAGFGTLSSILNADKEALLEVEGFGETTVNYLLNEFKKWKKEGVDFYKFAAATNAFKGLGEKLLSKIDKKYFEKVIDIEDCKNLLKIDGFSDIRVVEFVKGLIKYCVLRDLLPIKFKEEIIQITDELKGDNIVFTGFRDEEFEKYLKNKGAIVSSSISSKTTLLICKELDSNTSKENKAIELGIARIKLEEDIHYKNFIKSI